MDRRSPASGREEDMASTAGSVAHDRRSGVDPDVMTRDMHVEQVERAAHGLAEVNRRERDGVPIPAPIGTTTMKLGVPGDGPPVAVVGPGE